MKKIAGALCCILVLTMLVACGVPKLSGTYSSESFVAETEYVFDKDGTVDYKVITGGYVAVDMSGTYEINEDETEITLSFDESKTDLGSLLGTSTLSGTYAFERGEDYIQIGSVRYEADSAK